MADANSNTNLLKQAQLFADLSTEELESVSCRVALREFKKGEVILYEEDTNRYMYSVLEGEVKVYYSSEGGKESIVARTSRGGSSSSRGRMRYFRCRVVYPGMRLSRAVSSKFVFKARRRSFGGAGDHAPAARRNTSLEQAPCVSGVLRDHTSQPYFS